MGENGKTKVIVNEKSSLDGLFEEDFGKIGYIDGYVTEGTTHFAIVVFKDGDIKPIHISRLKALV